MKKFLFIFILFAGLISLGSCSSDDNEPEVPSTQETETVPDGKVLIGETTLQSCRRRQSCTFANDSSSWG